MRVNVVQPAPETYYDSYSADRITIATAVAPIPFNRYPPFTIYDLYHHSVLHADHSYPCPQSLSTCS